MAEYCLIQYHAIMTQTIFSKTPDKRHSQVSLQCCINTLRKRQNCHHFADDIFKCIFLNENVWILLRISLKFVPKLHINNIPALVQKMAWHWPGDKPSLNQCGLDYWSLSLNELKVGVCRMIYKTPDCTSYGKIAISNARDFANALNL